MKKVGLDAVESMLKGNAGNEEVENKEESIKRILENGENVLVRIPNLEECVSAYESHSAYENKDPIILPTTCHKENGGEDLYDKTSRIIMRRANALYNKDKKRSKDLWTIAKKLEPKMRMQFGFFDLTTGEPFIVEMSQKHGEALLSQIKKYANKSGEMAFELERTGAGSDTGYSLSPVMDELEEEELENFELTATQEFDVEQYKNIRYFKNENQQQEDVNRFLDVMNIDLEKLVAENNERPENNEQQQEEAV